ncbi:alpha-hydroxy acid oxidase [Stenotrophobium rhamnosiphilum]|uniref:Alpha-hydroxy-acid oxidizing enzyme n=1 Tax=Stenotrophobium rhamnosiphilum TaxID=2029166 RepID=A0A2T5ME56_9GAMM|nr:alpha-hydroxy acid oxidase [Stenotrophobium rhamnosiphilum]PTU30855.1 alpha-hydroxy-acid oxidizing enzyme [Stenotrophobium rhamnosiphilum]
MSLDRCFNIADLRALAKRKLPAPMFHYIDGGADDEWTMRRNSAAFNDYELLPSALVDVSSVNLRTRVLGVDVEMPLLLSPTGMSRLFHHHKELGAARAAASAGLMYSLSTMATTNIEDVAKASDGPKMFQVYVFRDRGLTRELVQRCKESGYKALCLTVDTPVAGNRERDHRNGMVMPPKFSLASLMSFVASPEWSLNYLRDPNFDLANVAHRVDALKGGSLGLMNYVNSQFDATVSWKDAEWLAGEWGGSFVIKGLSRPDDAKAAKRIGASALMISNHGGRQLDCSPAAIDCLAPIRDAVGDGLELIVDGGIRRGSDILKAVALGANACSIGRPYLYGLAAGGEKGVTRALTLLKAELLRDMALLGCNEMKQVDQTRVQYRKNN